MRNDPLAQYMRDFIDRTETVMRTDSDNCPRTIFERGLRGAALLYGYGAAFRRRLYRQGRLSIKRLPVPVISVGNLAVGGTGKTPMTIYLARLLKDGHYRPAIISRGYGGTSEKSGAVVSDGVLIRSDSVRSGDEPLMMARQAKAVPVLVGRDRYLSGLRAIKEFECDSIILDDGFQHMRLYRDLNIVLLDAQSPLGNGFTIPRGILREPSTALADAHAVVFTRASLKKIAIPADIASIIKALPSFQTRQKVYLHHAVNESGSPSKLTLTDLSEKKVCLFSGIARNDDFQDTVRSLGAKIQHHAKFGDHHRYDRAELNHILRTAIQTGSQLLLTTEKDFARLNPQYPWPLPFAVIGVKMTFTRDTFDRFVMQSMETAAKAASI